MSFCGDRRSPDPSANEGRDVDDALADGRVEDLAQELADVTAVGAQSVEELAEVGGIDLADRRVAEFRAVDLPKRIAVDVAGTRPEAGVLDQRPRVLDHGRGPASDHHR